MAHRRKDRVTHGIGGVYGVVFLCAVVVSSVVGCVEPPAPQPRECPPCPKAVECTQESADEDEGSMRARLKQELLSEIKAETREAWRQEFEREMQAEQARDLAPRPVNLGASAVKRPQTKPETLSPIVKSERDSLGMKLLKLTCTSGIDHRLPIDERETFSIADASVFCHVEISAADEEEHTITIRFTHSTGLSQSYTLPVSQSPAWRTWSKLNLTKSMTGKWLCEVFNEDNVLLASRPFVVVDE